MRKIEIAEKSSLIVLQSTVVTSFRLQELALPLPGTVNQNVCMTPSWDPVPVTSFNLPPAPTDFVVAVMAAATPSAPQPVVTVKFWEGVHRPTASPAGYQSFLLGMSRVSSQRKILLQLLKQIIE